ncbi:MAG: hypothetical protein ACRDRK_05020 [Pseudonocardia sp.]
MTAATEQRRDLVDSAAPPDPPPLSQELVCLLDLPAELPAELTIAQVAASAGVSAHELHLASADSGGWPRHARDPNHEMGATSW